MIAEKQWLDLLAVAELESGDVTEATLLQRTFAIYDTANGIFVTDVHCSHAGAKLCDGYFDGQRIECPLHQGLFDCQSGAALASPALRPLKTFEVRVHDGIVQIHLPSVSK